MKQSISNNSGITLTFTDDGITWESGISRFRFPYGSIKQVKIGFLGFEITPHKGNSLTFAFHKQYKPMMQEMLDFTQNAIRNAPPAEPIDLTAEKKAEDDRIADAARRAASANEHRMRCNVCGHVFCYTEQDLKDNMTNAAIAGLSGIGTIASAIGGTRYDMYEQSKMSSRNVSKIVDYNRCPSCRSSNLTRLSNDELTVPPQNATTRASSQMEDIKKFKELLDMGIITQEEFDAKKKQLLGL